jgi:choline dehydrogenase
MSRLARWRRRFDGRAPGRAPARPPGAPGRAVPLMEADYVIVGAGSAGCTMAWRLAEAGRSVLVIEAGGSDRGPLIRMPGALSYPMNMARYDWGFASEPEPHLGNRRLACRAAR